ncbi:uncharacterized protein [Ptychodera flava]|uniref:uncharacterized protein n=1 Tax=Ptychodera flava TaxID=63121 RepID=UPI00396A6A4E
MDGGDETSKVMTRARRLKSVRLVILILLLSTLIYIVKEKVSSESHETIVTEEPTFDHQLLLIGVGNIGLRHLQSLMTSTYSVDITVVDPSWSAIQRAQSMCDIERRTDSQIRVSFFDSLDTFSVGTRFDVVIIATNADVRRIVIEDVLACCKVQYLILEKVLFQTAVDHVEMKRLFDRYQVQTYVHAQWGTVPLAKYLKSRLKPPVDIHVEGGNWGLCCNSIHFLTLASFLNNQSSLTLDGSRLQPGYAESKRQGFVEIFGELTGQIATRDGVADVVLQCSSTGASGDRNLTFSNRQGRVVWNEKTGIALGTFKGNDDLNTVNEVKEYPFPMVSSWSRILVEQLLSTGQCDLPLYENVYKMSMALNDAFLAHLTEAQNEDAMEGICPIT